MASKLPIITAYLIVVAWAVSFILGIVSRDYNPPPTVHALMMLLAGSLYGPTFWKEISGRQRLQLPPEEGDPDQDPGGDRPPPRQDVGN